MAEGEATTSQMNKTLTEQKKKKCLSARLVRVLLKHYTDRDMLYAIMPFSL